ncbi:MAG: peptidoglycan-binding domain-containing protein, partial [Candidatus Magasanikbacteria bacterium]|nr:peptidoglycan-binding domain-containing protein [Candidatus Magasanikbacteria bacterium]
KFRSPDGGESQVYKIEPSVKKIETTQTALSEQSSVIVSEKIEEILKNNNFNLFSRNLKLGMQGEDVRELQKFLNANGFTLADQGFGSRGQETDYFGFLTKKALIKFQNQMKIEPAMGYLGPVTRGKMLDF